MPTPEEIKSMAREYARCTCIGTFDAQQREEDEKVEYDFALPVIKWLADRYCLVEKEKIQRAYKVNQGGVLSGAMTDNYDLVEYARGRNSQLKDLFGKEMLEEK